MFNKDFFIEYSQLSEKKKRSFLGSKDSKKKMKKMNILEKMKKREKSLVLAASEGIRKNIVAQEREGKITEEEKEKALMELLSSSCEAFKRLK